MRPTAAELDRYAVKENHLDVNSADLNVVTGGFGYTGRYIARKLLSAGQEVQTITGHPERESPFGDRVNNVRK